MFWWLHWYDVSLVKTCNKPLLQLSEKKIFDQKIFIKNLFNVNLKKFGYFENKSDNA